MTWEEVERLNFGDVVETRLRGRWYPVQFRHRLSPPLLYVRRRGRTKRGQAFPDLLRHNHEIRPPSPLSRMEPLAANVYADFLEERGEQRAADMLRATFPLHGQGVTE